MSRFSSPPVASVSIPDHRPTTFNERSTRASSSIVIALIIVTLIASVWIAVSITNAPGSLVTFIEVVFLLAAVAAILAKPYLGIAFIIGSLPILELLPSIPFATSIVSLLGGITLVSYFVQQSRINRTVVGRQRSSSTIYFSVLFIVWIVLSNPTAAYIESNRNWLFTLIQLFFLLWLASRLLTEKKVHRAVFICFSITATMSAFVALLTVTDPSLANRAAGLVGGANAAGRYFVIGMVFLNFLREDSTKIWFRLISMVGIGILLIGTMLTLSRTGLILAAIALLLILLRSASGRNRGRVSFIIFLAITFFWFVPDQVLNSVFAIFGPQTLDAITQGTDTVGLRYQLWNAGWSMWLDHPLAGVGIGQFTNNLPFYAGDFGLTGTHLLLGAHNMYVEVLSETGIIGLGLFLIILTTALWSLWRSSHHLDNEKADIAWIWLVTLILLMIGGVTKHDLDEKLLWVSLGAAVGLSYLHSQARAKPSSQ